MNTWVVIAPTMMAIKADAKPALRMPDASKRALEEAQRESHGSILVEQPSRVLRKGAGAEARTVCAT